LLMRNTNWGPRTLDGMLRPLGSSAAFFPLCGRPAQLANFCVTFAYRRHPQPKIVHPSQVHQKYCPKIDLHLI